MVFSELERRQRYLDKMTGGAADLKPLVTACLDDNPKNRPQLTQVSMTIKRAKDECSQKSSRDGKAGGKGAGAKSNVGRGKGGGNGSGGDKGRSGKRGKKGGRAR